MSKIKNYPDINQCKKLAEILPKESADMYYFTIIRDYPYSQGKIKTIAKIMDGSFSSNYDTPCWSLAALLDVLPLVETHKQTDGHKIYYYVDLYMKRKGKEIYLSTERHESLVDACYEMILKLHELNLL